MIPDEDDTSFWNGYADGEFDADNDLPEDDSGADDAEFPESYRSGYGAGYKGESE